MALLTYAGVAGTLLEGQVNGVFLLAFSVAFMQLLSGRCLLGGLFSGALWLKPQYAVVFPLVFVAKGRWRELLGMSITGLLIGLGSLAMIGPTGVVQYLSAIGQVGGYYASVGSLASPEAMANWRALLLHLLPGLPEQSGLLLTWGLGGATLLLSLLVWRGSWEARSPHFPLQMLVTVAAALIASPHSHLHGTVLLLAPVAFIVARPEKLIVSTGLLHLPLATGYSLALVAWVFRGVSWLFVPYLLAVAWMLARAIHSAEPQVCT